MRPSYLRIFVLLSLVACKPHVPEPIWKGEHLYYGTTRHETVCRGSFFRQEQHVVGLAALLGASLPEVIHYTWVTEANLPDYCEGRGSLRGCSYDDAPYVFSIKSFHHHELAHAVAGLAGLDGPIPFAEGFAEVFNDGGQPDTDRLPIEGVLRNFESDGPGYYTMGLFSRFLIERHGLDVFADFLRSTDRTTTFAQFSPIFEDIFGEPIETAMTDFETYPSCSEMDNRIAVVDCNLPLEPWQGQTVILSATLGCGQDDVLGPTADNLMLTTRAFRVEQAGSYAFAPSTPEGVSGFRVIKCGSCWDSFDVTLASDATATHDLTPGRYYVLFGREVDSPAELSLELTQL